MATQSQLALQMLAQLRVLDPSISAEIGTPERKIIDTVAQALAESQVDLDVLSGQFDIDSKFAADLDRFLGNFGFGRQSAVKATGFVTFMRSSASNYDIPIPQGTVVNAPANNETTQNLFTTTEGVTLTAGQTSVFAPIRANLAGAIGNVAANTITEFGGSVILGITSLTNTVPTTGGVDAETDDEFKLRFKNTVFRNLSGTYDQFLALAVSTAFTTKANVVGPISRYREYIQVPDVDDATADPDSGVSGNNPSGTGQYTSALSTVPFSKHIYDTVPYFISNNKAGLDALFFRQDTDYVLNSDPASKDLGDTYRGHVTGSGLDPLDVDALYQPNITFKNVYTDADDDVQSIRPGDVVLFEHSYMSTASRNDFAHNVTNCIDVFINGGNPTLATSVIPRPNTGVNIFVNTTTDPYYFENYRRDGEPNHRPIQGNIFTPLFWAPVLSLPDVIQVGNVNYLLGTHYWLIRDVSEIGSTVRARDGIEWSSTVPGQASGDSASGPFTGAKITANAAGSVTIPGYTYDKNMVDLQASLEGNKQTATDVLGHTATTRYFKLDVTIMYAPTASIADTNTSIQSALTDFFDGQYFGTTIQLSDLLQIIHNVGGVDNVRWSKDVLAAQGRTTDNSGSPRDRVVECDNSGEPLLNVILDRTTYGTASLQEVWKYYLTGDPTGGSYTLTFGSHTTADISVTADASAITSTLSAASIAATCTGGTGTTADPYVITFASNGVQSPNEFTANATKMTGGSTFNGDFYLKDDELPTLPSGALASDSVAGLILRPRAQNTWNQL
jgi:uncharacterized phage protein gp47/JayE